ncbi:aminodeoxychorismate/anthranilate synthase component II [uncultured Thermosynechococcus sp.]|uniref:anthranilate synthase component II n=1 Tax=uncultured Thermosynechococcus sp. TaxID=436945 RepID=UPI00261BE508|nr:aminodeoxychorismate/anthranilate synthase component II [uncultured Thermosynechococcus sp.]
MIIVIDNYDSFTYNLVQYLGELGATVQVVRNDVLSVEDALRLAPERIVLSPGPCTPNEAGICVPLIRAVAGNIPLLGVCLGHQAIGAAFGGEIVRALRPMHGKTSLIRHDGQGVFQGLPNPLRVIRYHSLVIRRESLPPELEITAETDEGEIMGVRHKQYPIEGVQFHPESIMSEAGLELLRNFLELR